MASGGTGEQRPPPRFSPGLAVQKHPGGPTLVTLSAGPGTGPWWLVVQRALGPLYLEQVGFAVTVEQDQLGQHRAADRRAGQPVRADRAVDDLSSPTSSSQRLASSTRRLGGRPRRPRGLRRHGRRDARRRAAASFPSAAGGVEYLGMLLGRFGVYGITIYGGYGAGRAAQSDQFTVVLRVRRGQRADRRAAGVLPHRHRRRLRHQPRARRARPTCRSSATTR